MPKRIIYFFVGVILTFLFVIFSYLVHKNLFIQLDFNTTVRFQDHISRRFDFLFSILSSIGTFEVMTIVLLVLLLFAKQLRAGIITFVFFVGFHLIEIYGKYFVHHPPPPQFMLRTLNLIQFSPFTVREVNSYPSGHSGRAMFISAILFVFILQSKKINLNTKIVFFCLVIFYDITMFVSRIYLGEHWLSDVIGGMILGSALGLFAGVFIKEKHNVSHVIHERKKKGLFSKYKIEIKKVE